MPIAYQGQLQSQTSNSLPNSLLGLNLQELTNLAIGSGQPAYRGQQLFDAVYRQKIERLDQVSTLPLEYRARLVEEGWGVGFPAIARKFISSDGTVRYLVELADGETVETVWMPEGDGGESGDGSEAGDEIESGVVAGLRPAGRGPSAPLRAGSAPSPHRSAQGQGRFIQRHPVRFDWSGDFSDAARIADAGCNRGPRIHDGWTDSRDRASPLRGNR